MLDDHRGIAAALRAGNAEQAEALGRRHAELGRLRIMDTRARDVTGVWDTSLG